MTLPLLQAPDQSPTLSSWAAPSPGPASSGGRPSPAGTPGPSSPGGTNFLGFEAAGRPSSAALCEIQPEPEPLPSAGGGPPSPAALAAAAAGVAAAAERGEEGWRAKGHSGPLVAAQVGGGSGWVGWVGRVGWSN